MEYFLHNPANEQTKQMPMKT